MKNGKELHTLADGGRQEAPTRDSNKLLPSSAGEQGALRPGQQAKQEPNVDKQSELTDALRD